MSTYTDRGLVEITQGLREAKTLLSRRRFESQSKMGILEAEVAALGKIEAALDAAIYVLREDQAQREALSKEAQ
jgi:hypothetical protein